MKNDTIAAIAAASQNGSISILRVSGSESICAVGNIFYKKASKSQDEIGEKNNTSDKYISAKHTLETAETHIIHYGYIGRSKKSPVSEASNSSAINEQDLYNKNYINSDIIEILDEVLVLLMRAPRSYTTEDVVEIHCHGGGFAAQKILELLIENGVRLAEPGEFTKRAYLNGRIDLTQAEAVMDVISSRSDIALANAEKGLSGHIKNKIIALRELLLTDTAYLEAALDDPEHISLDDFPSQLTSHLDEVEAEVSALIDSAENGRIISEGIKTAIIGRPNVGKSSLLNCLLRQDRAIVTDIAGTTRDTLEEEVRIGRVLLKLIDTAGIRSTSDEIEKIGVEKAKQAVEEADFVICVLDSSEALTDEDINAIKLCEKKNGVILLNKSDKPKVLTEEILKEQLENNIKNNKYYNSNDTDNFEINEKNYNINNSENNRKNKSNYFKNVDIKEDKIYKKILPFSAVSAEGLRDLEDYIDDLFFREFYSKKETSESEIYITNLRQKEALLETKNSIEKIRETIRQGLPEDFLSIDLQDAYESLGRIIGATIEDDLADKIFSEFCMGK